MFQYLGDGADNSDMNAGVFLVDSQPSGSALDQAENWVQWAEVSATSSALDWSGNAANTQYNLQQFWNLKAAHYSEDPTAWDKLDIRANCAWAALAELGTVKDNPPAQQTYFDQAAQAYQGAQAASDRLGIHPGLYSKRAAESSTYFAQIKASGSALDSRLSVAITDRATALLDQANTILGIPLWAWGLGALGVLWLLYGPKR